MTVIQAPVGLSVQRNADITPTWALCQERECTRRSGFHGPSICPAMEAVAREHRQAVLNTSEKELPKYRLNTENDNGLLAKPSIQFPAASLA